MILSVKLSRPSQTFADIPRIFISRCSRGNSLGVWLSIALDFEKMKALEEFSKIHETASSRNECT